MKRHDRAAALVFCCAAALCAIFLFLYRGGAGLAAEIVVDGKVVERIALSSPPREATVYAGGGFNVVRAGGGRAAVISADCPDKVCVQTGEISRAGEGAVCLPHKLVLRITGGKGSAVDAVSQ